MERVINCKANTYIVVCRRLLDAAQKMAKVGEQANGGEFEVEGNCGKGIN